MSYQKERDEFIARMSQEGLPLSATRALLRAATTLNRLAELACSSEAADRDRIPCPASTAASRAAVARGKAGAPCLCDGSGDEHETIPRITLADHRAELRAQAAVPAGWRIITQGDPRGYVLRVIPPSYAARNEGRDRFNLDAIGVPNAPSRLEF